MIKGLAHVCFVTRDLDASIDFYTNTLGFTPAFEFKNEQGERFGIYLHVSARQFIELFQAQKVEPADNQSYQHICLEVDDMEATVADLRNKGVEVGDISLGSDKSYQAWLTDPDGNKIELHAYTPESDQTPWLK